MDDMLSGLPETAAYLYERVTIFENGLQPYFKRLSVDLKDSHLKRDVAPLSENGPVSPGKSRSSRSHWRTHFSRQCGHRTREGKRGVSVERLVLHHLAQRICLPDLIVVCATLERFLQPSKFTTRHHNSSLVRPSMVLRPSIHPQLSTSVLPDVVPTPARAFPPSYRPPSSSTSCTGLINLLASSNPSAVLLPTPSPGSHSVSSNLSLSSSSLSNVVPLVIGRSVISTAPNTPNLSELTDRLEMPPSSLPTHSALGRSAKSPLSHLHLTPPHCRHANHQPPPPLILVQSLFRQ
ncbi:uncharacterized protein DEA37_0003358 [Paragonimus westermani]|uniref:Uncharacterized protein n=1 Tax=Paragonimus westermani TaxID=34504 RepID=A0A5J4NDU4_9TREM|nr:uncharacterized protein DEA37_0003358 [Paragonimus westermani]